MKILVLVKDKTEKELLNQMAANISKTHPNFAWDVTMDVEAFKAGLSAFRVVAISGLAYDGPADLSWPSPSVFLKTAKLKESIWSDIQEKILPAISRSVIEPVALVLDPKQLQLLLSMIGQAEKGFRFEHPDGYTIGVNTSENVDTALTSGDIASMLAAMWIFGAKGISLK